MPGVVVLVADQGQPAKALNVRSPRPHKGQQAGRRTCQREWAAAGPLRAPDKPYYCLPAELTQTPLVLRDIPPDLIFDLPDAPPQAVVLRLLTSELGEVDEVIIDDSSVPAAAAQPMTEAFRKTRFHSGEIGGTPVRSQIRIEVTLEKPSS